MCVGIYCTGLSLHETQRFAACRSGDFGALHCQPSINVDRSTALDLTTSAPIAANGC